MTQVFSVGRLILAASAGLVMAGSASAQQWEVGAMGGGGFYLNNSVSGTAGKGTVGFSPGWSAGGWLAHSSNGRLGGEIRYLFQRNDLKANSPNASAAFGGQSHLFHYDVVWHTNTREDRVRPYLAVGGGFKGYRGTGTERAFQPASDVAILSRTAEWKPMLSFGAGVKWQIAQRLMLRVEVRDYVTPFPKEVILPTPGNKVSGWVHDITPLVGLSYVLQ
ncbi:MAG: outer membrane beta-barrel protein [Bryobacteraceae bacterium]